MRANPTPDPTDGESTEEHDDCNCACGDNGASDEVEDLTLGIFKAFDDEGNQVGWILATILTDDDGNPILDDDQDYLPDEILQTTDMNGNQDDDLEYAETDLDDFTTFGEVYGVTKPQLDDAIAQLQAQQAANQQNQPEYQIEAVEEKNVTSNPTIETVTPLDRFSDQKVAEIQGFGQGLVQGYLDITRTVADSVIDTYNFVAWWGKTSRAIA
ncbi:hypothetical protein [Rubinisphaera italica]|uniref:Uncharacterized protein n=1 Tax=Rubinisphaera italica TaxID=2527969 RepID=A0A5C5X9P4_9PLAN|nr:hypothetical protein [Rubinisphaera italica]TWT59716.1 hypothetical protein Pan54_04260 [Rubinisphaera italica]